MNTPKGKTMQALDHTSNRSLAQMIVEDNRASRSWLQELDVQHWTTQISELASESSDHVNESAQCPSHGAKGSVELDQDSTNVLQNDHLNLESKISVRKPSCVSNAASRQKYAEESAVHSWYTKWFRDWWALEIGSMFLGTVCIVAIAVMLLQVDGSEMPQWRLGITIDAILSLLAGFSKSCLLMQTAEALGQLKWPFGEGAKRAIDVDRIDRATRGTWGSVVLLARARGVTLASLGAAIILLSLPLDLCFQQIVRYPVERKVDPTTNATIARAVVYDPDDNMSWRGDDWSISEDQSMTAVLYPAWFADQPVGPGVTFSCPTGNCTFDDFDSLALGFRCEPLPQKMLTRGCFNTPARWHSTYAYGKDAPQNISSCGYYLDIPDHGLELVTGYEVKGNGSVGETLALSFFELSDFYTNQLHFNGSLNFGHVGNRAMDFIIASTPQAFDGARANQTPMIQECEIHWEVQKIHAEVLDGKLHEHILGAVSNQDNVSPYWSALDANVYTLIPSFDLQDPHSANGSSVYRASNVTARKVWQTFTLRIPSTFVQPYRGDARVELRNQYILKEAWLEGYAVLKTMLHESVPWQTTEQVSSQMMKLTNIANQVMRNNKVSRRGQGDFIVGTAYRNVVLVDVNWEWFAFPATLWCIAVVFLAITIWRTSRIKGSGTYKTSLLPMLLNGEMEQVGEESKRARNMGSIRKLAKVSTVQFESLQEGWRAPGQRSSEM